LLTNLSLPLEGSSEQTTSGWSTEKDITGYGIKKKKPAWDGNSSIYMTYWTRKIMVM